MALCIAYSIVYSIKGTISMLKPIKKQPKRRSRRIACAGEKGGGGKTTTAIHIAYELHARGNKVIVIDNDPQQGFVSWNNTLPEDKQLTVVSISNVLREVELSIFDNACDYLVIDGAPGFDVDERLVKSMDLFGSILEREDTSSHAKKTIITEIKKIFGSVTSVYARASQIVNLVDFIVMPVKPSQQDILPMKNYIVNVIEPRLEMVGDVSYGILPTQHGGDNTQSYNVLRKAIELNEFSSFESSMKRREAYSKASFGSVVQLLAGADKDEQATLEVGFIVDEIERILS